MNELLKPFLALTAYMNAMLCSGVAFLSDIATMGKIMVGILALINIGLFATFTEYKVEVK